MNTSRDKIIARRDAIIAQNGWAVIGIHPDHRHDMFSYSVGFTETLGQPEVCFIGVPIEMARTLINDIGQGLRAKRLRLPKNGGRLSQVIQKWDVLVRPVPEKHARALARGAFERMHPKPIRLMQICIPDHAGRLPDDPSCDPQFVNFQDYTQFES